MCVYYSGRRRAYCTENTIKQNVTQQPVESRSEAHDYIIPSR